MMFMFYMTALNGIVKNPKSSFGGVGDGIYENDF